MVGRTDSLQTAPNLHDRMWELDGFGDYVKHSFHFQFIVRRRGITFTQMERNLERHSFCATQNVYGNGWGGIVGDLFKDQIREKVFSIFLNGSRFLQSACSWPMMSCFMPQAGVKRTIMVFVMVRPIYSEIKLTFHTFIQSYVTLHLLLTPWSIKTLP